MKTPAAMTETRDEAAAESPCLVKTMAEAFSAEPSLEAVRIDHAGQSVSVATLGKPDSLPIERDVGARIKRLQEGNERGHCQLLLGHEGCDTCPTPYPPGTGQGLTIERKPGMTTIARVTCPTAPKFWRWHSLPLPRLVPREVMLPDEAEHEHEWKLQLLAAVLCGTFGLVGYLIGPGRIQLPLFV